MHDMSRDNDVLKHDLRRMLYKHIAQYPGVNYKTLKNIFQLTDGTLRYHLDYLERAEKIKFSMKKGKRSYFPNPDDPGSTGIIGGSSRKVKLNESQLKVLRLVKKYPGISHKELVNYTRFKQHIVTGSLKKLMDIGAVRKSREKNDVGYEYISGDRLKYEMIQSLLSKFLNREIDEDTFLKLVKQLER